MKNKIYILIGILLTLSLSAQNIVVKTPPKEYAIVKADDIENIVKQNSVKLKLGNNFVKIFYDSLVKSPNIVFLTLD
ncbi:MAG: hypothetical protein KAI79_09665 [Bacteroidales bacterium]|nr:hypothetical protein [Bacteroidales bacterium]